MNASTTAPGDTMGQTDQSDSSSAEPPEPTNRGTSAAAALTLHNESPTPVDQRWLRDRLASALPLLPRTVQRVDVAMLDDAAMTVLHRRFHNIDQTTDVLTFDASESRESPLEVDIAACVDVAQRQAAARGHSIERELLLYVIHGLLHCMGFDDHDEAAAAAMHEQEDRVLDAIGVGRTFTAGGRARSAEQNAPDSDTPASHKDYSG